MCPEWWEFDIRGCYLTPNWGGVVMSIWANCLEIMVKKLEDVKGQLRSFAILWLEKTGLQWLCVVFKGKCTVLLVKFWFLLRLTVRKNLRGSTLAFDATVNSFLFYEPFSHVCPGDGNLNNQTSKLKCSGVARGMLKIRIDRYITQIGQRIGLFLFYNI